MEFTERVTEFAFRLDLLKRCLRTRPDDDATKQAVNDLVERFHEIERDLHSLFDQGSWDDLL